MKHSFSNIVRDVNRKCNFIKVNHNMIKYISIMVVALSFIACQNDSQQEQTTPDQSMQQDQMQQQQPAAQIEVSDDELEQFVEISTELQGAQMESQQEMVAIVEDEDLSLEVYNQIAESRDMGQSDEDIDVSSEDIEKFERASEGISEIGMEIEAEMEERIEDSGMTRERFQEINLALQQDPELQSRAQVMMQQQQGMQQQPQDGQ